MKKGSVSRRMVYLSRTSCLRHRPWEKQDNCKPVARDPSEKIALMDPNLSRLARIYFKKIFTENYTFVLTCSSRLIPVMAESFQISPDKIKV